MTSIPISAADRETFVAELDALADKLAKHFDEMPCEIQAAMLEVGHSLSSVRMKVARPVRMVSQAEQMGWKPVVSRK